MGRERAREPVPRESARTIRDAIRHELSTGPMTALELSSAVGIPHKAVAEHLEHLRRSAGAAGERFEIEPASCPDCGFEFRDRTRLTRPSRCPKCRSERIIAPRFRIVSR
jgi:transcriptional regulator